MAIVTDCSKEVNLSEAGPIGVAEVVLRIGTLPEHETAEPNLAAGSDNQVRIRQVGGVEMLGNRIRTQFCRYLVRRFTFRRPPILGNAETPRRFPHVRRKPQRR